MGYCFDIVRPPCPLPLALGLGSSAKTLAAVKSTEIQPKLGSRGRVEILVKKILVYRATRLNRSPSLNPSTKALATVLSKKEVISQAAALRKRARAGLGRTAEIEIY